MDLNIDVVNAFAGALAQWAGQAVTSGLYVSAVGSPVQATLTRIVNASIESAVAQVVPPGDVKVVTDALREHVGNRLDVDAADMTTPREVLRAWLMPLTEPAPYVAPRGYLAAYGVDLEELTDALYAAIRVRVRADALRGGPLWPLWNEWAAADRNREILDVLRGEEAHALQAEINRLTARLAVAETSAAEYLRDRDDLRAEISGLHADLARLERERAAAQAFATQVSADLRGAETENERLSTRVSALLSHVSDLQGRISALEHNLAPSPGLRPIRDLGWRPTSNNGWTEKPWKDIDRIIQARDESIRQMDRLKNRGREWPFTVARRGYDREAVEDWILAAENPMRRRMLPPPHFRRAFRGYAIGEVEAYVAARFPCRSRGPLFVAAVQEALSRRGYIFDLTRVRPAKLAKIQARCGLRGPEKLLGFAEWRGCWIACTTWGIRAYNGDGFFSFSYGEFDQIEMTVAEGRRSEQVAMDEPAISESVTVDFLVLAEGDAEIAIDCGGASTLRILHAIRELIPSAVQGEAR